MTRAGYVAGVALIALVAWLCLPVVALVLIVRDKITRFAGT